MNTELKLVTRSGDEKTKDVNLAADPEVSMDNLQSVTLPFTRDDIDRIDFDGSELKISLEDGELVLTEFLDETGDIKEIYTVNGQLLFKDTSDLISQLSAPAAGNVAADGNSSVFSFLDNQFPFLEGNGLGYRDLRGGLNGPDITVTDLDGDPDNPLVGLLLNEAPDVDSGSIIVDEESADNSLGLSAPTDADIPADTLTITVTGLPTLGTITLADGSAVAVDDTLTAAQLEGLEYDTPDDYDGSDPGDFTYDVFDGTDMVGGSVDITVNPVNDEPDVSSNSIEVDEESADNSLGLSAPTDADIPADTLTITVTGLPTLGTITLADGSAVAVDDTLTAAQLEGLQYDAPDDYDGSDPGDFTYDVFDGTATVGGSVDITVNPVNDEPDVSSNSIEVDEESADNSLGLSAPTDADIPADTLTITVTGLPTLGTITLADGSAVAVDDTLTAAQLEGLQYDAPDDYDGSDPGDFTYAVFDGTDTVAGSVDISVNPVNDEPDVDSGSIEVDEESADNSLGLSAPTDADVPADTLTITVTGLPTLGTITLADGSAVAVDDTLTAAQLEGLEYDAPDDYDGSDPGDFTYDVFDGTDTVGGSVDITVNPVNDEPDVSSNSIEVDEESADNSLGLSAPTDADIPADTLTITVTGLPTLGSITLADGSAVAVDDTLTAAQLEGLQYDAPDDYDGSDPGDFTYEVFDGTDTVGGSVDITVNPVNDEPDVSSNSIEVDEESADNSLGLSAPTDADVPADTLTITVTGLPTLGTITLADGSAVAVDDTLTAAQLEGLEYDAPDDYDGSDPGDFTYDVFDGTDMVGGSVDITVNPVNDEPDVSSNSIEVDEESADNSLGLSAPTDADIPADTLTITVTGLPTLGTITLADGSAVAVDDTLTAAQLEGLQYDAPDDYDGSDPGDFTYDVFDGTATVGGSVDITVNPVNDEPDVSSNSIEVDEESADNSLGLSAPTDADIPADTLTITVTGLPTLGTITLADGSAVAVDDTLTAAQLEGLEYDAPDDYDGSDPGDFTYDVFDGTDTVGGSVDITVNPVNDEPDVSSNSIEVDEESADNSLGLSAPTDADIPADTLTITVTGLPTLGTITLADGSAIAVDDTLTAAQLEGLEYDAPDDYDGSDPGDFTYDVFDGTDTVAGSVDIKVLAVNDAPTSTDDSVTTDEDTPIILAVSDFGNFSDVDGDSLAKVKITSLETDGRLEYSDDGGNTWQNVTLNQEFTTAELDADVLRFNPDADENGSPYATFGFSVNDGTAYSTSSYVLTVNVTPVDDDGCPTDPDPTDNNGVYIFGSTGQDNQIDAGDGFDILVVNDVSLNFDTLRTYDGIERIHLCADGTNAKNSQKIFDLNAEDVLDVVATGSILENENILIITGDPTLPGNGNINAGDTVLLDPDEWNSAGTVEYMGDSYDSYTSMFDGEEVTLWIEDEVVVDI
ncbi:Ig-like domain-containing protein [Amphritea sp. HPY]|uniref:Ig-like domain-containing protein n=1 Tax=Amphritea sp. HPY TaxID=3421652 RepID=UPI003D7D2393